MNIQIQIDVTPGTARRLAYIGVTLLVAGVATAAYALPVTFVSHQTLTAAQLNQNFQDLESRLVVATAALEAKADKRQVPIITSWETYVPTLTTPKGVAVANQTSVGYYRRVGNSLEVRIATSFTAAPQSNAPWWLWGVPKDLTIDLSGSGPIGGATIGGGLAQQGTLVSFALGPYVRSAKGVAASPAGTNSPYVNDASPFVFEGGALVTLYFTVPIQDWTATQ